jgi:hypothetical protein
MKEDHDDDDDDDDDSSGWNNLNLQHEMIWNYYLFDN